MPFSPLPVRKRLLIHTKCMFFLSCGYSWLTFDFKFEIIYKYKTDVIHKLFNHFKNHIINVTHLTIAYYSINLHIQIIVKFCRQFCILVYFFFKKVDTFQRKIHEFNLLEILGLIVKNSQNVWEYDRQKKQSYKHIFFVGKLQRTLKQFPYISFQLSFLKIN